MRTIAMKNGLILGTIFSVNFMLSTLRNPFLSLVLNLLSVVILMITYKMAKHYRNESCNGHISFGQSFLFILSMFFYAALISTIVKFFFLKYAYPTFLVEVQTEILDVFKAFNIKGVDVSGNLTMFTPIYFSFAYLWADIILGIIVSLALSGFVQKKKISNEPPSL